MVIWIAFVNIREKYGTCTVRWMVHLLRASWCVEREVKVMRVALDAAMTKRDDEALSATTSRRVNSKSTKPSIHGRADALRGVDIRKMPSELG
jgi:hypothetical protein